MKGYDKKPTGQRPTTGEPRFIPLDGNRIDEASGTVPRGPANPAIRPEPYQTKDGRRGVKAPPPHAPPKPAVRGGVDSTGRKKP